MTHIPTHEFKLKGKEKKQRHKELKRRRKAILKKYKSFSPSEPISSPLPELYSLYSTTDHEVLYYHAVKQYRKMASNAVVGNICIGLVSGIAAGSISSDIIPSLVDIFTAFSLAQVFLLLAYIAILFAFSYFCVWVAHFILPFFLPNDLWEAELELISELLGLEQYFSIQTQDPASTPEETEPTASPEDPESTEPAPVPEETESTAPPEDSKSPDPAGTSRPC